MNKFDKDEFITECLAAVRSGNGASTAVKEIVDRVVSNPSTIEAEVGDRTISPMMTVWHRSEELTALHIVWPPGRRSLKERAISPLIGDIGQRTHPAHIERSQPLLRPPAPHTE